MSAEVFLRFTTLFTHITLDSLFGELSIFLPAMTIVSLKKRKQTLQEYLENVKQDRDNAANWSNGRKKLHGDGTYAGHLSHANDTRQRWLVQGDGTELAANTL
ncbi:unnamed protein product [Rhizoctonia solani]|uniref:Uncharacterized protein n=1 Tax=Rhizoctonia solani TaxID=456999 RepID=A0A8H3DG02_9AGAM|nr:unnamed protein product [Rhizoctonia solani]CAE6524065.1 unnamed protein product [Rhizoctonia solani]